MVPFHCSALLPYEQRHTSPEFRRFQRFTRYQLSVLEGGQLIAFVRLVGEDAAGYIFDWHSKPTMFRAYRAIREHPPMLEAAEKFEMANAPRLDAETGYAVLRAMIDGGWRKGQPPQIVRRALQSMKGDGMSAERIAATLPHISRHQVQNWVTPRPPKGRERAKAAALLAIG